MGITTQETQWNNAHMMTNSSSDPIRKWKLAGMSLCALLISSCSDITNTPGVTQVDGTYEYTEVDQDPLEPLNRGFFKTNSILDHVIFKPVSQVYKAIVPDEGRKAVTNFLDNISSPVSFVNSILQGDVENAMATFWRFTLNSTFGLAGLHDFATEDAGLTARDADFGQTLARYGVASGPYLFLPIFGPTTLRDGVGRGVDVVFDPVTWTHDNVWPVAKWSATGIDYRTRNMDVIDDLYENSLDPYAAFRSAYIQHRSKTIREWMPEEQQ